VARFVVQVLEGSPPLSLHHNTEIAYQRCTSGRVSQPLTVSGVSEHCAYKRLVNVTPVADGEQRRLGFHGLSPTCC